jgi:ribonuclease P protein component
LIWSVRGRREFERLRRSTCRARTDGLWCRYLSDPSARPLRIAFAVGRSYGTAVERNRLRRQLRAMVERACGSRGLRSGWLLIGVTSTATAERTFPSATSTRAQLERLLDRLVERIASGATERGQ